MNTKQITVAAFLKGKPGKESQMRTELLALVAPSRKDGGCLSYDLHQSSEDPAQFLFYENWASKADLDAHLQTPAFKAAFAKIGQLVAEEPRITLWQKLSQ